MPIAPDAQYCIDSAVACLNITTDIAFGARIGQIDVNAIVDNVGPRFDATLTEQVLNWRRHEATPYQRALMSFQGIQHAATAMEELRWGITGMMAESYICQRRGLANLWGLPPIPGDVFATFKTPVPSIQALRTPDMVQAVFEQRPVFHTYLTLLKQQYDRFAESIQEIDFLDFLVKITVEINFPEQAEPPFLFTPDTFPTEMVEPPVPDQRPIRKAVRRGLRAMNNLIAPNAYKAFVSSNGLLIDGQLFNYRAKKVQSILLHTADPTSAHIPYDLDIVSKAGVVLGSGCIVFDQTPVLDQVIALALHVRDRELEIDLLKKGNWRCTNDGREDEALQDIIRSPKIQTSFASTERDIPLPQISYLVGRRKKIMNCIEADVDKILIEMAGIPVAFYDLMTKPPERIFTLNRNRDGLILAPKLLDVLRECDWTLPVKQADYANRVTLRLK